MKLGLVFFVLVPSVALAQVDVVESGPENEVVLEVMETDEPGDAQYAAPQPAPSQPAPSQPAPSQPAPYAQSVQAAPVGYTPQAQVLDERLELNQQLDQVPIGGSIAMATIGAGLGLVFSAGAWLVKNASGVSRCLSVDEDECGTTNRTGTAVMGSIAAAGFTLGIIGLVRLVVRITKRARIRRDFRQRASLDAEGFTLRF